MTPKPCGCMLKHFAISVTTFSGKGFLMMFIIICIVSVIITAGCMYHRYDNYMPFILHKCYHCDHVCC